MESGKDPCYPSIFNDVIGPVMRGPSSSHCAGALRIGRLARDLMGGELDEVLVVFDANGSLATTHESQGSDMGFAGGLLGWDATDERLPESCDAIQEAGIRIAVEISEYEAQHPNTYRITLRNSTEQHRMTAVSVGGGMIEVIEIDGAPVSMAGDYFETLIYFNSDGSELVDYLQDNIEADEIRLLSGAGTRFIEVKAQRPLAEQHISELRARDGMSQIRTLSPVLPVLSRRALSVPFATCEEMLQYNQDRNLDLWELAVRYESARGNMPLEQVFEEMGKDRGHHARSRSWPASRARNTRTASSATSPAPSRPRWRRAAFWTAAS